MPTRAQRVLPGHSLCDVSCLVIGDAGGCAFHPVYDGASTKSISGLGHIFKLGLVDESPPVKILTGKASSVCYAYRVGVVPMLLPAPQTSAVPSFYVLLELFKLCHEFGDLVVLSGITQEANDVRQNGSLVFPAQAYPWTPTSIDALPTNMRHAVLAPTSTSSLLHLPARLWAPGMIGKFIDFHSGDEIEMTSSGLRPLLRRLADSRTMSESELAAIDLVSNPHHHVPESALCCVLCEPTQAVSERCFAVPSASAVPKVLDMSQGKVKRIRFGPMPRLLTPGDSGYAAKVRDVFVAHCALKHLSGEQLENWIQIHGVPGLQPGDSRYIADCDVCRRYAGRLPSRPRVSPTAHSLRPAYLRGQLWSMDGMKFQRQQYFGSMNVANCFTEEHRDGGFTLPYYMRSNSAENVMRAVHYLWAWARTVLKIQVVILWCDHFSSYKDVDFVAELRARYGIEMVMIGPHEQWRNNRAEKFNQLVAHGMRVTIPSLVGKVIRGVTIDALNVHSYAPILAHYAATVTLMFRPNSRYEKLLNHPSCDYHELFQVKAPCPMLMQPTFSTCYLSHGHDETYNSQVGPLRIACIYVAPSVCCPFVSPLTTHDNCSLVINETSGKPLIVGNARLTFCTHSPKGMLAAFDALDVPTPVTPGHPLLDYPIRELDTEPASDTGPAKRVDFVFSQLPDDNDKSTAGAISDAAPAGELVAPPAHTTSDAASPRTTVAPLLPPPVSEGASVDFVDDGEPVLRALLDEPVKWRAKLKDGKNRAKCKRYSQDGAGTSLHNALLLGASMADLQYDMKTGVFDFVESSLSRRVQLYRGAAARKARARAFANAETLITATHDVDTSRILGPTTLPNGSLGVGHDIRRDPILGFVTSLPPTCERFTYYHSFCGLNSPHYAFPRVGGVAVGGNDTDSNMRDIFLEQTGVAATCDFRTPNMEQLESADLFIAGSNCEPFSEAVGDPPGLADERAWHYVHQFDAVGRLSPKKRPLMLLSENVLGVIMHDNGRAQDLLVQRMRSWGYIPQEMTLDSRVHGSVEQRKRLYTAFVPHDIVDAIGHLPAPRKSDERPTTASIMVDIATRAREDPSLLHNRADYYNVDVTNRVVSHDGLHLIMRRFDKPWQFKVHASDGAAITQRCTGLNPTGLTTQSGYVVAHTLLESSRILGFPDDANVGQHLGASSCRRAIAGAMNISTLNALGDVISPFLAAAKRFRCSGVAVADTSAVEPEIHSVARAQQRASATKLADTTPATFIQPLTNPSDIAATLRVSDDEAAALMDAERYMHHRTTFKDPDAGVTCYFIATPESVLPDAAALSDVTELCYSISDEFGIVLEEGELRDVSHIKDPAERRMAMEATIKEVEGLCSIGTFDLTTALPAGRSALTSKLVLKMKYRADGAIDKYKSRLVVRGHAAAAGLDCFSTFSPMATLSSVRVLLAVAVQHGWEVMHTDVPQAFVQAFVEEDAWVQLPKGMRINKAANPRILKLIRALYGLPSSPQNWAKCLTKCLTDAGFTQLHSDSCVFHISDNDGCVMVATEVDDLVITGTTGHPMWAKLHQILLDRFKITQWEPIQSFLGINIQYDVTLGVLTMDVKSKIDTLIAEHNMETTYDYAVPHVDGEHADLADPDVAAREKITEQDRYLVSNYRSIVGALIYISIACRPDIAYSVGKLSRAMHAPTFMHARWLLRCLGYLRTRSGLAIRYTRAPSQAARLFSSLDSNVDPVSVVDTDFITAISDGTVDTVLTDAVRAMSDASFAPGDEKERKSVSGYSLFIYGSLFSWKSKLQPITAGSTHESELIALALAADEVVWVHRLLSEIKFIVGNATSSSPRFLNFISKDNLLGHVPKVDPSEQLTVPARFASHPAVEQAHPADDIILMQPMVLYGDNMGSLFTSKNPDVSARSKHLDCRYYKIRRYIRDDMISLRYVQTDRNVADFFTKGLGTKKFRAFRDILFNTARDVDVVAYCLPDAECVFFVDLITDSSGNLVVHDGSLFRADCRGRAMRLPTS